MINGFSLSKFLSKTLNDEKHTTNKIDKKKQLASRALKCKTRREYWLLSNARNKKLKSPSARTYNSLLKNVYLNGAIPLVPTQFHKFRDFRPSSIKELQNPFRTA